MRAEIGREHRLLQEKESHLRHPKVTRNGTNFSAERRIRGLGKLWERYPTGDGKYFKLTFLVSLRSSSKLSSKQVKESSELSASS